MTNPATSGLCAAMFDVDDGTGVCEKFGAHAQHGGVVVRGVFRCHRCRAVTAGGDPDRDRRCRCAKAAS